MTTLQTIHARQYSEMLGIRKPSFVSPNEKKEKIEDKLKVDPPSSHLIKIKNSQKCVIL